MTFDLLLQAYLLLLELVGLAAGVAFAVAGVCASAVAAPNGRGGGDACDVPGACRALFAARSLSCLAAASAAAPAYITPAVLLALLGFRRRPTAPLWKCAAAVFSLALLGFPLVVLGFRRPGAPT